MRGSDGWIRAVSHQVGLRVSRRARVTGHRRYDQCTTKYRNESSVRFHGSELLWLDFAYVRYPRRLCSRVARFARTRIRADHRRAISALQDKKMRLWILRAEKNGV